MQWALQRRSIHRSMLPCWASASSHGELMDSLPVPINSSGRGNKADLSLTRTCTRTAVNQVICHSPGSLRLQVLTRAICLQGPVCGRL
jgi:hypothetical protein